MRTLLVLVAIAVAIPSAQVRPVVEVQGLVTAADSRVALPRARLAVAASGAPIEPVFSDDRGRFLIAVPSTATTPMTLTVRKAGFVTTTLQLSAADVAAGREIDVRLPRGASITGRVVTSAGAVVPSAAVLVRPVGGAAEETPPVAVRTDDLGEYHIGGLEQGRYAVQVLDGVPTDLSFSAAPGIGAIAAEDRLVAINRDLLARPSEVPATTGDPVAIAVRAGDDVIAGDLVLARIPTVAACRTSRDLPPDGAITASIAGRVLDPMGRPLPCVGVTVRPSEGPSLNVSTGLDGQYVHNGLAAGAYTVEAAKWGYATRRYGEGQSNPGGAAVVLRRGESARADIVLPRRPSVTGRVLDDLGDPVSGVSVRALQIRAMGDLTMAVYAPGIGVRSTDDHGRYRLFGFTPGRYLVGVSFEATVSGPDGVYGYMPMFYPAGVDAATASPLDLGEEGDVTGVDFVMFRAPVHRITGTAVDAAGRAAREAIVFPSVRSTGILLEPRHVPVGPDGSFTVSNLAPGEYVVQALGSAERSDGYGILPPDFGMSYATVGDADAAPVLVRATEGAVVEGRMFARGGDAQLRQLLFENDVWLWPLPVDMDRSWAGRERRAGFALLDGGRFRVSGVTGLRRFVIERAPEEWYVESVTVNGRDALHAPFDFGSGQARFDDVQVVLSDEAAVVTSRIVDARGELAPNASAIVFATDRNLWFRESQHVRVARRRPDGTIRVGGLPPGEYFVAAYDPPDAVSFRFAGWMDTALLERLTAGAERVTLAPRERRQIELTVSR